MTKSTKELRQEWEERSCKFDSIFEEKPKRSYFQKELAKRLERATPFVAQAITFTVVLGLFALTWMLTH